MFNLSSQYRNFWNERNRRSLYWGILFLVLSLIIQFFAVRYSAKSATNFVGDLFLDNLPTINSARYVIVEGGFLMILIGTIVLFAKPRYLLFATKAVPMLILARAFFVTLTHLGIYPQQIVLGSSPLERLYIFLNLQDGFFFSGHTALTLLIAFIMWPDRFWRYFFIAASIIFGASVLLAHVHYSIDVFAVPFIVYSIFKLAQKFFPADYALAREEV